jgi:hypothetical protein
VRRENAAQSPRDDVRLTITLTLAADGKTMSIDHTQTNAPSLSGTLRRAN